MRRNVLIDNSVFESLGVSTKKNYDVIGNFLEIYSSENGTFA